MRHKALFILVGIMILAAAGIMYRSKNKPVKIKGETFRVEVVTTAAARARGLSGRRALSTDRGMLFISFDQPRPGIWMKNMNFPIDIIWLQSFDWSNSGIVDIAPNVPPPSPENPDDTLPVYYPRDRADAVLELPAGTSARLNLKIGDLVVFP